MILTPPVPKRHGYLVNMAGIKDSVWEINFKFNVTGENKERIDDPNVILLHISKRQSSIKDLENRQSMVLQGIVIYLISHSQYNNDFQDIAVYKIFDKTFRVNITQDYIRKQSKDPSKVCPIRMTNHDKGIWFRISFDLRTSTLRLLKSINDKDFEDCFSITIPDKLLTKSSFVSVHSLTGDKIANKVNLLSLGAYTSKPSEAPVRKGKVKDIDAQDGEGKKAAEIYDSEFGDAIADNIDSIMSEEDIANEFGGDKNLTLERILREHEILETSLDVLSVEFRETHDFVKSLIEGVADRKGYRTLIDELKTFKMDIIDLDGISRNLTATLSNISMIHRELRLLSMIPETHTRIPETLDKIVTEQEREMPEELYDLSKKLRDFRQWMDSSYNYQAELQDKMALNLYQKKHAVAEGLRKNTRLWVIMALIVLLVALALYSWRKFKSVEKRHLLQEPRNQSSHHPFFIYYQVQLFCSLYF
eukprot:TRINITY_DN1983_c0_g3_i1.p1 TRINITY_DN1983_c0_g3~~TRINITY_DN1983_c0_g3_i1.p1  ORF type:complete len:476 (+),score=134.00 TRINITY_DN1983_c0_g3_i1:122-1549(+)